MPRYVLPQHSTVVETAIQAFGNRARVAILRCISEHQPIGRSEIAQRIGITASTAGNHLAGLESAGLIVSDPPADVRRQGQHVTYRYNRTIAAELLADFGRELGVVDRDGHIIEEPAQDN